MRQSLINRFFETIFCILVMTLGTRIFFLFVALFLHPCGSDVFFLFGFPFCTILAKPLKGSGGKRSMGKLCVDARTVKPRSVWTY